MEIDFHLLKLQQLATYDLDITRVPQKIFHNSPKGMNLEDLKVLCDKITNINIPFLSSAQQISLESFVAGFAQPFESMLSFEGLAVMVAGTAIFGLAGIAASMAGIALLPAFTIAGDIIGYVSLAGAVGAGISAIKDGADIAMSKNEVDANKNWKELGNDMAGLLLSLPLAPKGMNKINSIVKKNLEQRRIASSLRQWAEAEDLPETIYRTMSTRDISDIRNNQRYFPDIETLLRGIPDENRGYIRYSTVSGYDEKMALVLRKSRTILKNNIKHRLSLWNDRVIHPSVDKDHLAQFIVDRASIFTEEAIIRQSGKNSVVANDYEYILSDSLPFLDDLADAVRSTIVPNPPAFVENELIRATATHCLDEIALLVKGNTGAQYNYMFEMPYFLART